MSSTRTYDEDETARIFEAAATPVPAGRAPAAARGLTLEELQAIGQEVGIPPARIAGAAAALDSERSAVPRRTTLGMPIGVGRTVDLPRAMTEREWAVLVVELRETFRAQGRDRSAGEIRHWANGNLHACVEPTLAGWRLRLGTVKGDAAALNSVGVAGVVLGVATSGSMLASGEPITAGLFLLAGLGGGTFAFNALRLPRWARTREAQMDRIIARVREIMERDPQD